MSRLAWSGAAIVAVLFLGCLGDESSKPLPAPVPTDGPNQVVVYVPSMT